MIPASVWSRVRAALLDILVVAMLFFAALIAPAIACVIAGVPIKQGTPGFWLLVALGYGLVPWIYWALLQSGTGRATLGMRWAGLVVVTETGGALSFWRASALLADNRPAR